MLERRWRCRRRLLYIALGVSCFSLGLNFIHGVGLDGGIWTLEDGSGGEEACY